MKVVDGAALFIGIDWELGGEVGVEYLKGLLDLIAMLKCYVVEKACDVENVFWQVSQQNIGHLLKKPLEFPSTVLLFFSLKSTRVEKGSGPFNFC